MKIGAKRVIDAGFVIGIVSSVIGGVAVVCAVSYYYMEKQKTLV